MQVALRLKFSQHINSEFASTLTAPGVECSQNDIEQPEEYRQRDDNPNNHH